MIGHKIVAIALCFLIASGISAEAQKYPNRADDDLPRNTIGGGYRVMERTPVYRSRASGERAFFYLPKNSRVEVLGKFEGWGIFSVYTPERFKTLLTEAAPDEKTQYGWVRLDRLRRIDTRKIRCPDVPPASSTDAYFDCAGEYDTVSATDVIVFLWGYRHAGNTYRRLGQSRLNDCIKTCRDEPKCVGFFYAASEANCELKNTGEVDLGFTTMKEPPFPNFSGVKLAN